MSWKGERRGFGERGFLFPPRRRQRPAARFRRRRNATEWEQGPGRERKPRVGKEEGPRFRGADYEICRWRYFLNVKKVTKERRGFAVGAPARRSRDGNGKIAVRGGEAMAAKRTTAQGGFAQRNAARDFARQTQKAGPMTGQPGFAAGEMRPNGSKGRGGNGSRVWEKRKTPAFAGTITSLRRPTFLALRK